MTARQRRARPPHYHLRTCVGCRRRDERSKLLRVALVRVPVTAPEHPEHAADDGGQVSLVPDPAARLPGRGAWLHPTTHCLDQAIRRRAYGRALRSTEVADVAQLYTWIAQHAPAPTSAADRPRGHRDGAGAAEESKTESGFDTDEQSMSTQQ